MPLVRFVINSVTEPEYQSLMKGYRAARDAPPPRPPFVGRVRRAIVRIVSSLPLVGRKIGVAATENEKQVYCGPHPVLDPRFLEFCITVAQYMSSGYAVGPGDGNEFFYSYDMVTLSGHVPGEIENYDGWNKLITRIAPHSYSEEIPDIPTHAHLRTLRALTHDVSISALVNRLALWLSYFVVSTHYCHKIVACRPKTGDMKVLDTRFFRSFAQHMSL